MRKALTSVAVLALAFGTPAAVLAQDASGTGSDATGQQLSEAGFGNARTLEGVQVARVTDGEGNTFFVLGGLERAIGGWAGSGAVTAPATGGEAGAVTDMVGSGSEPAAGAGGGTEAAGAGATGGSGAADTALGTAETAEGRAGEAGTEDPLAGQNLTEQVQTGGAGPASLEEQLSAVGFSDYQLLEEAGVAEVTVGEGDGQVLHVITGIGE